MVLTTVDAEGSDTDTGDKEPDWISQSRARACGAADPIGRANRNASQTSGINKNEKDFKTAPVEAGDVQHQPLRSVGASITSYSLVKPNHSGRV